MNDPRRPRGILNERTRKYLLDPIEDHGDLTEYGRELKELLDDFEVESGSARERQIRQQIRDSTMNAILDFNLLAGNLEERDKRRILNDGWDPEHHHECGESPILFDMRDSLPVLITFIYQLYLIDQDAVEFASDQLAETVRKGVESAHATDGQVATAEVDIDVTLGTEIDELLEQYESQGPEAITEEEGWILRQHDLIDAEQFAEVVMTADN